jgi:hypothetical protein
MKYISVNFQPLGTNVGALHVIVFCEGALLYRMEMLADCWEQIKKLLCPREAWKQPTCQFQL